jgi:hypothetical protein
LGEGNPWVKAILSGLRLLQASGRRSEPTKDKAPNCRSRGDPLRASDVSVIHSEKGSKIISTSKFQT